ncbi:MAG: c-type cytochrome [Anaerolineae bacterium]|nr:c-type cytochrome [Anaerolineae bacterium]
MYRRIIALTLIVAGLAVFWVAAQSAAAAPPASKPAAGDPTKGEYLFNLAGGCGCHMGPAGFLAGGTEYKGPFGTVYARNITSDPETGIGTWTEEEIVTALRTGKAKDGHQLFPIMVYPALSGMSDQDAADLAAFLMTVPPIKNEVPPTVLNFPVPPFVAPVPPSATAPTGGVARGGYIVNVASHCSACHTPTLPDGSPDMSKYLAGGPIEGEVAHNITPDMETGIGSWTEENIANFLQTGMRPDGTPAGGLMALVIQGGLNKITDADAAAVAAYLKTVPAVSNDPNAQAQQLPATGGDMNNLPFVLALVAGGLVLLGAGALVLRGSRNKN